MKKKSIAILAVTGLALVTALVVANRPQQESETTKITEVALKPAETPPSPVKAKPKIERASQIVANPPQNYQLARMSAQMKAQRESIVFNEEQARGVQRSVELVYRPALQAMGFDDELNRKIEALLIQRGEAGYIAREVFLGSTEEQRQGLNLRLVAEFARSEVDREIAATLPDAVAEQVSQMVNATDFLIQVNQSIAQAFAEAGEPMEPKQILPMAVLMKETYGSVGPSEIAQNASNIDSSSGLRPIDEVAIERASAILTPIQLAAFRKLQSKRNVEALSKS